MKKKLLKKTFLKKTFLKKKALVSVLAGAVLLSGAALAQSQGMLLNSERATQQVGTVPLTGNLQLADGRYRADYRRDDERAYDEYLHEGASHDDHRNDEHGGWDADAPYEAEDELAQLQLLQDLLKLNPQQQKIVTDIQASVRTLNALEQLSMDEVDVGSGGISRQLSREIATMEVVLEELKQMEANWSRLVAGLSDRQRQLLERLELN